MMVYTIKWTQPYRNWEPVEFPITNFTEALAVINLIKSKL